MNAVMWESEEDQMSSLEVIENQLYSLNKRVDDVKADGKATQLAVQALSDRVDRRMDKTDAKIDAVDKKFEARYDALDRKFDARCDALDKKFDALNDKFDAKFHALNDKFDAKFHALNEKVSAKFDTLSNRIETLAVSIARLESVHMTVVWVCGGFLTLVFSLIGLGKALSWF